MKTGTTSKIKFLRLKRRLRLPHWQTIGILEALWQSTYNNAPRGDIGKLTDEDIAASMEYDGDAEELINALVDSGWLDRDEKYRLLIHDWHTHCATSLKGSFAKNQIQFAIADAKPSAKQPAKQTANSDLPSESPSNAPPNLTKPNHTLPNHNQTKCAASAADSNQLPANCESTDPPQDGKPAKRNPEREIAIPQALAAEPFPAAWSQWIAFRRKSRMSCREECLSLQLKKLLPLGPQLASECVLKSLESGWTGIFPEKMTNANKRNLAGGAGQTFDPNAAASNPNHGKM